MFAQLGARPKTVPILAAQALAHGLLCAFTIIPASGLFLSAYGAGRLPYVYLLVALTGFLAAPFFGRALSRWSVASVARPVLGGLIVLQVACWLVLANSGAQWPSVVLQVLFPVSLQIGFVFLGTQAGRLLTMREMKAWFSVIASGFSVGFLIGGLVAPVVIDVFDATNAVLPCTAAATACLLALITITHRRHADALSFQPGPARRASSAPRRIEGAPVRVMIALLFAYQVLSALGTQLAEFLLYDRAAARYSTSEELARFTSHFNVGLNVVELLFLFFVAGPLLARFGLRLGLFANPIVVSAATVAALLATVGAGAGSLVLFIAAGSARVGDIVLTNSTTRTATNTAYQALPVEIRPLIQARAEGLGVPGAIGFGGIILLLVVHVANGGVGAIISVTLVICVLWLAATGALHRRYRHQLRENLGHRVHTPHLVAYGDAETAGLIDLMLHDELGAGKEFDRARLENPALLAAAISAARLNPTSPPNDLARLVRLARQPDPTLIEVLLDLTRHPSRQVRSVAMQQLSRCAGADDPRCRQMVPELIGICAGDAAEIVHALAHLPEGRQFDELHNSLLDESRTLADCTLHALAFVLDAPTMVRARQWLLSDDRQRSTALESIEVNTPSALRPAVMGILELGRDVAAAERNLRDCVTPWPTVVDVVEDLRDDPRRCWNEPWLAACAEAALAADEAR